MYLYDLITREGMELTKPNIQMAEQKHFLITESAEIPSIQESYGFDEGTVIDCLNYDENIRHEVYSGYDFISLLYFYVNPDLQLLTHEINIYISKQYCILVIPEDHQYERLGQLRQRMIQRIQNYKNQDLTPVKIYYFVWDEILRDYLDHMQMTEDGMIKVENRMLKNEVDKEMLHIVRRIKKTVYNIKKVLRPVLYIGDAILINENDIINKENMKYFKNIDTRINKLYDFSASLQEYSNQMLSLYESQTAMQTNAIVNKLTILTVFFSPLTIITGIYGMNFVNMPELSWQYGYFFAILLMIAVCLIVYLVLKIKKWI